MCCQPLLKAARSYLTNVGSVLVFRRVAHTQQNVDTGGPRPILFSESANGIAMDYGYPKGRHVNV